jgi:hypothetical protein
VIAGAGGLEGSRLGISESVCRKRLANMLQMRKPLSIVFPCVSFICICVGKN